MTNEYLEVNGNMVHHTAVIDKDVVIGVGNSFGPNTIIAKGTVIGNRNKFYSNVVIGSDPEIRDYSPQEGCGVEIGSDNVFREFVVVNAGSHQTTRIGNDCFIQRSVHIGHDCTVGHSVTLSTSTVLAGHVEIHSFATLGMLAAIHQRTVIGLGSMVGMGCVVRRDVKGFLTVMGDPAREIGLNRRKIEKLGLEILEVRAWIQEGQSSIGKKSRLTELVGLDSAYFSETRQL